MRRIVKWLGYLALCLSVSAVVAWWAIGPTWRTFLSNPPADTDVLFWTQSQRDTGFSLSDKLPIVDSVKIKSGGAARELPLGEPLAIDVDVDAYLKSQNSAAVIVLHKGKIRLERYGLNQAGDDRWTSFSVAKSISSTLVGAAIKDGHIRSLQDKVSDYVPALKNSPYAQVNIQQLLTMTSGVKWVEDYADPNSDVALFRLAKSDAGEPAIVSYLKNLPRAHAPGQFFNYSTGETNLVGVVVAAATEMSLAEYLSQKIWRPFGMQQDASWVTSKSGEEISGCCVQAAARDFARFGQFILEGGRIGGSSILPDGWISNATTEQVTLPDDPIRNYGYQWWILDQGAFMAIGIFGQGIFIDPVRELVIVTNSSWRDARGVEANQAAERYSFQNKVRSAIDAENQ